MSEIVAAGALEALRGSPFDIEVRAGITSVFRVPDAGQACACMMQTFATWGRRAPDEMWDGTWLEQVAESGEYTTQNDRVQVRARPAE